MDPRAEARSKKDAKVLKGADIVKLMKELSEDPATAETGRSYSTDEEHGMSRKIDKLARRLKLNEAGLMLPSRGWHIVKRIPPLVEN